MYSGRFDSRNNVTWCQLTSVNEFKNNEEATGYTLSQDIN